MLVLMLFFGAIGFLVGMAAGAPLVGAALGVVVAGVVGFLPAPW